jgi:hypothetical protein
MPIDRCRYPHRKARRSRARRNPTIYRLNHPTAKIQTIGTCHICPPNRSETQNHVSANLEIPFCDSDYPEGALDMANLQKKIGCLEDGGGKTIPAPVLFGYHRHWV